MEDFEKAIKQNTLAREQKVAQFATDISGGDRMVDQITADFLEKGGKRAVIGEIRSFGGRDHIKTANGWKFYGKGKGSKAKAHKESSGKKDSKKVSLSDFVDSAPDGEFKVKLKSGKTSSVTYTKESFKQSLKKDGQSAFSVDHNFTGYEKVPKKKSKQVSLMKPQEGKTYQLTERGKGEKYTVYLEATDGSHMVDMSWDDKGLAQKFADKHGFPTKKVTSATSGESIDGKTYLQQYNTYSQKYASADKKDIEKYVMEGKKSAIQAEHDAIMDVAKERGIEKKKAESKNASKKTLSTAERKVRELMTVIEHQEHIDQGPPEPGSRGAKAWDELQSLVESGKITKEQFNNQVKDGFSSSAVDFEGAFRDASFGSDKKKETPKKETPKKAVDPEKAKATARRRENLKESIADVKDGIKDHAKYLKDRHGFAKNSKAQESLTKLSKEAPKLMRSLSSKLSKFGEVSFRFEGDKNGDPSHNATSLSITVDKYDTIEKFESEWKAYKEKYPYSAQKDRFVADKFGEALGKVLSGKYSQTGFTYFGRNVGFNIAGTAGTNHSMRIDDLRKSTESTMIKAEANDILDKYIEETK